MLTETGHPLCVDNFGDYCTWDRAIALAGGLDGDVSEGSPLVTRLLEHVERQSGEYTLTREDAAEILNAAREMK